MVVKTTRIPDCHPDKPYFAKGLCAKCYKRQEYQADIIKNRARSLAWRNNHIEKARESTRNWRAANPEKVSTYAKNYTLSETQRQKTRERAALWAKNNPERHRENGRKHYAANPERFRENKRRWVSANKEKDLASKRKWDKTHPENKREHCAKRRARKRGAAVNDLTYVQWADVLIRYRHTCFYCGNVPNKLEQDHVLPLSRGGNHTISNIVPACGYCNRSKGNKTLEEFLAVMSY